MNSSDPVRTRIDTGVMWSALAVYFAVWLVTTTGKFAPALIGHGLLVTTVYIGMHVYEIKYRHHCYGSADSTAFPAVLVAVVLSVGVHSQLGIWPWPVVSPETGVFLGSHALAFMGGHLAALLYSAIVWSVCWWTYRRVVR
jgi:hypothetical protein